jgi:glycosyl transferase family 2
MGLYKRARKAIAAIPSLIGRLRRPRVIMTLVCRNESDIITEQIAFHLAMGVDFVLATDNGSVDRTPELLDHFRRMGRLRLLHEPSWTHEQGKWMTRMAQLATTEHGADWVINSDADEFWWPRRGDLRATFSDLDPKVNIVVANRVNFRPSTSEDGPFYERMLVRELVSSRFRGGPLDPKVAHRAFPDVRVKPGNHNAELGGRKRRRAPANTIEILHFPVRSYDQWFRKIMEGSAAYDSNPNLQPGIAAGWRYLREHYVRTGKLRELYNSLAIQGSEITDAADGANLIVDIRLRDFLRNSQELFAKIHSAS